MTTSTNNKPEKLLSLYNITVHIHHRRIISRSDSQWCNEAKYVKRYVVCWHSNDIDGAKLAVLQKVPKVSHLEGWRIDEIYIQQVEEIKNFIMEIY